MPGNPVDKAEDEEEGLVRGDNGTRCYLCCADCAPLWDADPARYADIDAVGVTGTRPGGSAEYS